MLKKKLTLQESPVKYYFVKCNSYTVIFKQGKNITGNTVRDRNGKLNICIGCWHVLGLTVFPDEN
jgi:hypothetical protein